ncbi:hypothetical protein GWK47_037976 [Chionoecetes opilio]|uniref:HAT C-terminal dimerisation domain-containing protein n=1 Tax=Chionoecetes opilio TaxID=41210 RepID=A0A8J5CMD1_CHIOP|nr:hypothetical protein GWK47_037976 [Chionoecetes opilio]
MVHLNVGRDDRGVKVYLCELARVARRSASGVIVIEGYTDVNGEEIVVLHDSQRCCVAVNSEECLFLHDIQRCCECDHIDHGDHKSVEHIAGLENDVVVYSNALSCVLCVCNNSSKKQCFHALMSPGPTATEGTNSTRLSNKMGKEVESWCSENQRNKLLEQAMFPALSDAAWVDVFIKYNTAIPSSAAVERLFSQGSDIMKAKQESDSPYRTCWQRQIQGEVSRAAVLNPMAPECEKDKLMMEDLEVDNICNNQCEDISQFVATLQTMAEKYSNADTVGALSTAVKRLKKVRNTNMLNSLLYELGSDVCTTGPGRGKIRCQPTSIARRGPGIKT